MAGKYKLYTEMIIYDNNILKINVQNRSLYAISRRHYTTNTSNIKNV